MRVHSWKSGVAAILVIAVRGSAVGQQPPKIIAFENGWLTWTNQQTNVVYDVQWAPRLTAPWTNTWGQLCGQPVTAQVMSAQVPMFYRVAVRTGGLDSLVARYDFKEGAGTTVHDTSGVMPPMDLTICTGQSPPPQADDSHVTWLGGGGLRVEDVAIMMATNVTKLYAALTNSNEMSIEAWIKPTTMELEGPARIVTLSYGDANRNVSLVAEGAGNYYHLRLRTDSTLGDVENGLPRLYTIGFVSTGLTHIVATHDQAQREAIYINGKCVASGIRDGGGGFSNWDVFYLFALGEEIVPPTGTLSATGELSGVSLDVTQGKAHGRVYRNYEGANDEYLVYAPLDDDADTWVGIYFPETDDFTVGTHNAGTEFDVNVDWFWNGEPEALAEALAATSGVVEVTSAGGGRWAATYDLQFPDGQHLAGSFDVPVLPTEGRHDGNPRTFYGEYHRVSVYSRALTEGEVRLLHTDRPK